jgi:hypothetical protein
MIGKKTERGIAAAFLVAGAYCGVQAVGAAIDMNTADNSGDLTASISSEQGMKSWGYTGAGALAVSAAFAYEGIFRKEELSIEPRG